MTLTEGLETDPATGTASRRTLTLRTLVWQTTTRFARLNRERKASWIRTFADQHALSTALFVGAQVTGNEQDGIVEKALDGPLKVVAACNIESLPLPWPSVAGDARQLPFRTGSVDLVVSNAVIEHVGDEADQRAFVAEHVRVGRSWVLTTPNRWFPIEPHTATLLRHWSPAWRGRQPDFTRMLSRRELRRLLPEGASIVGHWWSPTFIAASAQGSA